MTESDVGFDSDHEVSSSHNKFIEAVANLDKGQRISKLQRSEPALEVSEFHLVKSGIANRDAVQIGDLVKSLGKKAQHTELTKRVKTARLKSKLLRKPLEKPQAERIKRIVGFDSSKKDLEKWNAIIAKNRSSGSLVFPLKHASLKRDPAQEFTKRFRLQSDLEKELAALEPEKKEEEKEETRCDKFRMTLKEAISRRQEVARTRAQQSYKEARAHRLRKIKSKKFHRVQRKAKAKLELKEFEELQKKDPEAALEKLEQLDKARAEERMSLRHKSTGQWAKNKLVRAKYDKDTRQELAQQLSIGRELTQKLRKESDDDEEDEEEDSEFLENGKLDKDNPWTTSKKSENEIDEFIKSYRKYWDEKNVKENTPELSTNNQTTELSNSSKLETGEIEVEVEEKNLGSKSVGTSAWSVEHLKPLKTLQNSISKNAKNLKTNSKKNKTVENITEIFETMEDELRKKTSSKLECMKKKLENSARISKKVVKKTAEDKEEREEDSLKVLELRPSNKMSLRPNLDGPLSETSGKETSGTSEKSNLKELVSSRLETVILEKKKPSELEIDPTKYLEVRPRYVHNELPKVLNGDDEALDDSPAEEEEDEEEKKHRIISEAFADDDVVEEFRREKEEEVRKSLPEKLDLSLPGWGSWSSGRGRGRGRKRHRRPVLHLPKEQPRRDENKGDVIIFEDSKTKLKEHLVRELPYPFTSVEDFEASIRMPLGRDFLPENAHTALTKPRVRTKLGKIIEPMDDSVLVDLKEKNDSKLVAKRKAKSVKVGGVRKKTKTKEIKKSIRE